MTKEAQDGIGGDMLPFVMKELVMLVMKKKALSLGDALYYIYSSTLYETLLKEETKTWYLSTLSLYDLLEKEKAKRRKQDKDSSKVLLFKMFCMENYRVKEGLTAEEVLLLFSKHSVFPFLEETFEMLHTQDKDYILDSISVYIKNRKDEK